MADKSIDDPKFKGPLPNAQNETAPKGKGFFEAYNSPEDEAALDEAWRRLDAKKKAKEEAELAAKNS